MRPLLPLLLLAALSVGQSRQNSAPSSSPASGSAALPTGFTAPSGYGDRIYPLLGDVGLDVTHYDLSLRSDPRIDSVSGRAVLSVTATRELPQINLDYSGPPLKGVKVNGQAARSARSGEKLLILPPQPIAQGAAFTVTVAYSGVPAFKLDSSDGGGLRLGWITQEGASYVLSEPDGSHTFFPCNDVPADGASYSLHLDVPAGYTAIASGVQTGQRTVAGRVLSDFELPQQIPTYALTVHVGKLQLETQGQVDGVSIRNAFPADLSDKVRSAFTQTPEMIRFLSSRFGRFPFTVYGVAVAQDPELPALETATLSTFPSRVEQPTVALHELAHMWFGDTLRLGDWSDVWLNEGFATYAELLWAEHQGQDGGALMARWYAQLQKTSARGLVAAQPGELFDSSSYLRGALTLQALRVQIGDAQMQRVLSQYVSRFSGQSVRTADLLSVVREVAGQSGLDALAPWIDGPELPPRPAALTKP
jgi:aminopeptidase N